MKNLENYGVQELNAQEIRETDGGVDLEKQGYGFGYFCARLLKKAVEGVLPW